MRTEPSMVAYGRSPAPRFGNGGPASVPASGPRCSSISVITVCGGDPFHLRNQWRGLLSGTILPDEWILVSPNGPAAAPDPAPFPIRMRSKGPRDAVESRAEALDYAARAAHGDVLVFLDEHCIPHSRFLECMRRAVRSGPRLWKAQQRLLSASFPSRRWYPEDLEVFGRCRSSEPPLAIDELYVCDRCDDTWPPTFAIDRESYRRLAGPDGRRDDFAIDAADLPTIARAHGVGFGLSGARVYRQVSPTDVGILGCFE